jgi:hypothetical protein
MKKIDFLIIVILLILYFNIKIFLRKLIEKRGINLKLEIK